LSLCCGIHVHSSQQVIFCLHVQMRYIIEAGLLEARITNRTLVLPSFVYARACTVERYVEPLFHMRR
jgi:hypothetical protein